VVQTLLTSNRPVDDWGKLLGDSAAVTAMLDRLLHHGHVLKCGPRSWRTKTGSPGESVRCRIFCHIFACAIVSRTTEFVVAEHSFGGE
jgi:hypothetical protein